jgi:hypothetical protein
MVEYRIDFKESKIEHRRIIKNALEIMQDNGQVREVVRDTRYYWVTEKDAQDIVEELAKFKGISITRLQGSLLR